MAPGGLEASSRTLASATLAAVRVGASFTAVTVAAMVSVAPEKAEVPPVVAVLTLVPLMPLVWSQARIVRPDATVPLKFAFGWK